MSHISTKIIPLLGRFKLPKLYSLKEKELTKALSWVVTQCAEAIPTGVFTDVGSSA
jgi:hypothetical protein